MAFDKDKPASSTSLRTSNPEILANWDALETGLNREHEFSTGGTTADQAHHKRGSARMFSQTDAPATRVDGTAFTSEDLGSLWIDTDNNKIYSLTVTTPTWTLISTEIIATIVAAIHTWAAIQTFALGCVFTKTPTWTEAALLKDAFLKARNQANNANLNLLKANTSDLLELMDGSVLATATETGDGDRTIADKKYVDDQLLTGITFSAYTNLDSENNAMLKAHAYQAATAGWVTATGNLGTTGATLKGYVGLTTNPAGAGDLIAAEKNAAAPDEDRAICFPVAKDEYFEITCTDTPTIRWKSIGTLSKPVDNN